jgi:hypothetical protein
MTVLLQLVDKLATSLLWTHHVDMTSCEIVSDVCTKSLTYAVHTYPRFLWQKCVYNICIYILTKIKSMYIKSGQLFPKEIQLWIFRSMIIQDKFLIRLSRTAIDTCFVPKPCPHSRVQRSRGKRPAMPHDRPRHDGHLSTERLYIHT